jgi:hypothetical protein
MAALTATAITLAGVAPSPVAVAASDTIAEAQFGSNGIVVRVINGGASSDTVTITDPNLTAMGSAATNPTVAVANGTSKMIAIGRNAINPSTGVATIAHSYTTTVTIEAWKY